MTSLAAKQAELIVPISQAAITATIVACFTASSSKEERHQGNYFIHRWVPPDVVLQQHAPFWVSTIPPAEAGLS